MVLAGLSVISLHGMDNKPSIKAIETNKPLQNGNGASSSSRSVPDCVAHSIPPMVQKAALSVGDMQKAMTNDAIASTAAHIKKTANSYSHDFRLLFFTFLAKFCNERTSISKNKKIVSKNKKIIKDIVFNYIFERIRTYKDDEPDDLLQTSVASFTFNEYREHDRKLLLIIRAMGRFEAVKPLLPDLDEKMLESLDESKS